MARRPRGECTWCGASCAIRQDGVVTGHKMGERYCPGAFKPPVEPLPWLDEDL